MFKALCDERKAPCLASWPPPMRCVKIFSTIHARAIMQTTLVALVPLTSQPKMGWRAYVIAYKPGGVVILGSQLKKSLLQYFCACGMWKTSSWLKDMRTGPYLRFAGRKHTRYGTGTV